LEVDPTRMCELLVGLPDVTVLGVDDIEDGPLVIHVEQAGPRPPCVGCGELPQVKDREVVELVDLPCFGRRTRLAWRKVRFECRNDDCEMISWTWDDTRIGCPRQALSDRAARWATLQVGRYGRTVSEVAGELGCAWHTINDAVVSYGEALLDADPGRIGTVTALGLDEALFARTGPFRRQHWSTQIVDVAAGRLLDVVEGRTAAGPSAWLARRGPAWRATIAWATLDLSGPYRAVFDTMLPDATQIADPFHVIKLANSKLDECRRRVQNQTLGHRGRKSDPLYRARRLLTKADERLTDPGRTKLVGLLEAGDPDGEVCTTRHAKNWSVPSTTTPTPRWPSPSSPAWAPTFRIPPIRPRSTPWAGP
jgi:transposase